MSSEDPTSKPGSNRRGSYVPTDPMAIRALAHPVRIKLLGMLAHAGTLTATQAGDWLGESPANCAFHLRTLAKYGFVEEAGGGKGRERPWRRTYSSLGLTAFGDPEYAEAAAAFADMAFTELLAEARNAMLAKASWPAEWQQLPAREAIAYMTPAEAVQLSEELNELLDRHAERLDPACRPPEAIPVELLLMAWPQLNLRGMPATKPRNPPADEATET